jgi:uncharacterized protein
VIRFLLWVALIAAVVYWWRKSKAATRPVPAQDKQAVPMVRCQYCQVHVPQHQALLQQAQWFCCAAHASAHGAPREH